MLSNASIDVAFHDTYKYIYYIIFLIFIELNIILLYNTIKYIYTDDINNYIMFKKNKTYSFNLDKEIKSIDYYKFSKFYTDNEDKFKDYIEQFFVGLLDGDGSITVDYISLNKKRVRIVIALNNLEENHIMIDYLVKYIGGRKAVERKDKYVTWYCTSRTELNKVLIILGKYPLLTSSKLCQLKFAKLFIDNIDNKELGKLEFERLRSNKYEKQDVIINKYNNSIELPSYYSSWLSGFIEAEGHFKLIKSTTNGIHTSQFVIGQNYDKYILNYILQYFNSNSKVSIAMNKSGIDYYKIHLSNKILRERLFDHFDKYPLLGYKNSQYHYWKNNH